MKYGLIGEKLGHSFSKTIHESLGYEYELREIEADKLDDFMRDRDFQGINVTIPYKERVIPYLDFIDEGAKAIGAVNTIVNKSGKLYGYNTDFYGMKMLFTHAEIDPSGKKVAILGSGGTSKTASAVLSSLGASEILRVSRSGKDGAITYGELYENHSDLEIIVNTTPVGMFPDIYDRPLDISRFDGLLGVIDAIYNPLRTTLINDALARGINAEGGLYMLVGQAVKAAEIFLGISYAEETVDRIFENIRQKKENIVLIGMPACGKSTVGRILAEGFNRPLIDTDELIEKRAKMSIKDIFEKQGEAEFRRLESEVIKEIAQRDGQIISTGGGAILREENVSALKYNGKLFFIDRPIESLIPTESRPLSSNKVDIKNRFKERYGIYCDVCDVKVDAKCDASTVAKKITEIF